MEGNFVLFLHTSRRYCTDDLTLLDLVIRFSSHSSAVLGFITYAKFTPPNKYNIDGKQFLSTFRNKILTTRNVLLPLF